MKTVAQVHREAFDCIDTPESRCHTAIRIACEEGIAFRGVDGTWLARLALAAAKYARGRDSVYATVEVQAIGRIAHDLPEPQPWLVTLPYAPDGVDPIASGRDAHEWPHRDAVVQMIRTELERTSQ